MADPYRRQGKTHNEDELSMTTRLQIVGTCAFLSCMLFQDQAFATNTQEPYIYELDLEEKAMTTVINMTLPSAAYQCARYVSRFAKKSRIKQLR